MRVKQPLKTCVFQRLPCFNLTKGLPEEALQQPPAQQGNQQDLLQGGDHDVDDGHGANDNYGANYQGVDL